jgi:hypothetical protein
MQILHTQKYRLNKNEKCQEIHRKQQPFLSWAYNYALQFWRYKSKSWEMTINFAKYKLVYLWKD